MLHKLLTPIADLIAGSNAEGAVIDGVETDGSYVALVHMRRATEAGFTLPSNAVYTVPSGKKAVVVMLLPTATMQADFAYRRMRLQDTTSTQTVVEESQFNQGGIPGFTSNGEDGKPVPEAAEGAVLSLDVWNADANARSMGGAVILKIVSA